MPSARDSLGSLLAVGVLFSLSCSRGVGGEETAAVAAIPAAPDPAAPATLPVGPPTGVDIDLLRLGGPGDAVVVEARGAPFITAEEFDAWLGTYPLNVTATDELGAKRQALDQMATFRLLLDRARAAGYEAKGGATTDARSIVLRYLGDQIRNVAGVSDAEAERYFEEHREQFGAIDVSEIAPEIRMAALKGSVRGLQVSREIEEEKRAAELRIILSNPVSLERAEHEKPR